MLRTLATLAALAWALPGLAAGHPLLANDTGKTVLRRFAAGNDMGLALVSSQGTSLFLDPRYTRVVPDAAAITHDHHVDQGIVAAATAAGAKVAIQAPGSFAVKEVKVTGIAASHSEAPVRSPPDYVLYLVEVDGLRLLFLPCNWQKEFTPEQRAAIGPVDVATITAENEPGGRNAKRSLALARSLRPHLLLVMTHHVPDYETAAFDLEDEGAKAEDVRDPLVLDPVALRAVRERVVNLVGTLPMEPR